VSGGKSLNQANLQQSKMTLDHPCPNCRSGYMSVFFTQEGVPINSCLLLPDVEEARGFPRGRVKLGFCSNCGFISNLAFDPSLIEYSERYEETQGFSPTFNSFHKALAERLVERHQLYDKKILEIGCGKGEFLNMLCKLGHNKGVGFDPGYIADREELEAVENVDFIADFYSSKYSDYESDFVCCKMTLEHIPDTADFIDQVGYSIDASRGTTVFFQVPDATRILEDCAFEDIYYEHCSYFYSGSLSLLFHNYGLEILDVSTEYDDQYLTIEAKAIADESRTPLQGDVQRHTIAGYVASFSERYKQKVAEWQKVLDECQEEGRKVVMWGSGSKGVAFLTSLERSDMLDYVVDINPYRQDHYMVGFGQKIISPEFLEEYGPDVVIIMNRIYADEIRQMLTDMSLSPKLLAL
jgi:SAM-dependent methyltransferase